MSSVTVILIRHGHAEFVAVERFSGHGVDLAPLSLEGVAEADTAGRVLEAAPPDLIIASPMTRSLQTAMIISWHVERRVKVEVDLHEWMPDDTQQWHGPTVPNAAYKEMTACGGEWPVGQTRAWEPLSAVRRRTESVLARYEHVAELLVVCHSVVIEATTSVRGCQHCESVPYRPS